MAHIMMHYKKEITLILFAFVTISSGCNVRALDESEIRYFKYIESMQDYYKTEPGSFEEEILYAQKVTSKIDDYKTDNNEYPYSLDYLDLDAIPAPALMRQPADFNAWERWLSYYRITADEFVLCIEEDYMMQYSSLIYKNSNRLWEKSDCSIYRKQQKLETEDEERNAVVKNKAVFNRKLTRYTVEFQDGETLEIMDKWPYFNIGDCVIIFFSENTPPRIALGDDCWK